MSFLTGTQAELLYSLPASVTKNTYTTQAPISVPASSTLPHCVVPANYFSAVPSGIGRSLLLCARGTIANTSVATFNGALGWDTGQVSIANSIVYRATVAPTASITSLWQLEVFYTCQQIGSAGLTLQVNGEYKESVVVSGSASAGSLTTLFQTSLTGLNAEASAFIDLWGTWSASSASNTTTVHQMQLFGLN